MGVWDHLVLVCGGCQGDWGDLLRHQTGPPLERLCDYFFPKKHLVKDADFHTSGVSKTSDFG